jgi:hypothetical protein
VLDARHAIELDVGGGDELQAVAPGWRKSEAPAGQHRQALALDGNVDRLLVIDEEAEVTAVVGRLGAALLSARSLKPRSAQHGNRHRRARRSDRFRAGR